MFSHCQRAQPHRINELVSTEQRQLASKMFNIFVQLKNIKPNGWPSLLAPGHYCSPLFLLLTTAWLDRYPGQLSISLTLWPRAKLLNLHRLSSQGVWHFVSTLSGLDDRVLIFIYYTECNIVRGIVLLSRLAINLSNLHSRTALKNKFSHRVRPPLGSPPISALY